MKPARFPLQMKKLISTFIVLACFSSTSANTYYRTRSGSDGMLALTDRCHMSLTLREISQTWDRIGKVSLAGRYCSRFCITRQSQRTEAAKKQKRTSISRRVVKTDKAPQGIGIYSQAIVAGDLVFTAGQIGIDPKTGQMVEGGFQAQAEQVLRNLSAVLEAAGSDMSLVLKTTVFLADMDDFNAMNEIYRRHFKEDPPARSTVQVARLPRNARIEIEAVALVKN